MMHTWSTMEFEMFWDEFTKDKNIRDDDVTKAVAMAAFEQGLRDGITRYAWWKDGEQFVGTSGRSLKRAMDEV